MHLSVVCVAPLFLSFTIGYAGLQERIRRYRWVIWAGPVLSMTLLLTNSIHHWYWERLEMVSLPGVIFFIRVPAPAFWLLVLGSYTSIFAGIVILGWAFFRSPGLYRRDPCRPEKTFIQQARHPCGDNRSDGRSRN